jgi:hypothetical protein
LERGAFFAGAGVQLLGIFSQRQSSDYTEIWAVSLDETGGYSPSNDQIEDNWEFDVVRYPVQWKKAGLRPFQRR